jgi:hypothetical protein
MRFNLSLALRACVDRSLLRQPRVEIDGLGPIRLGLGGLAEHGVGVAAVQVRLGELGVSLDRLRVVGDEVSCERAAAVMS